jgi:hypothetical protein
MFSSLDIGRERLQVLIEVFEEHLMNLSLILNEEESQIVEVARNESLVVCELDWDSNEFIDVLNNRVKTLK